MLLCTFFPSFYQSLTVDKSISLLLRRVEKIVSRFFAWHWRRSFRKILFDGYFGNGCPSQTGLLPKKNSPRSWKTNKCLVTYQRKYSWWRKRADDEIVLFSALAYYSQCSLGEVAWTRKSFNYVITYLYYYWEGFFLLNTVPEEKSLSINPYTW